MSVIDLYYGARRYSYKLSKFVKNHVVPLPVLAEFLAENTSCPAERIQREGQLWNDVVFVGDRASQCSDVCDIAGVGGAVHFYARRYGRPGFSSIVCGSSYPRYGAGYITLILKHCPYPDLDGYFVNAIWGPPIPYPELYLIRDEETLLKAKDFWSKFAYKAVPRFIDPRWVILDHAVSYQEKVALEKSLKMRLSFGGRVSVDSSYRSCASDPDGSFYHYFGK